MMKNLTTNRIYNDTYILSREFRRDIDRLVFALWKASAPEDEPSTNSMGGGSRLLNASTSRAGRNERESSEVF